VPRGGLGKGLSALIPGSELEVGGELLELPVGAIYPSPLQPREEFDAAAMEELVTSIRQHGLIQPILVRPRGEHYELVAGERRWRASQLAGLARVPAMIRDFDDQQALQISLVENLQRADLNPLEVASALQELVDKHGFSQEELAERLGKSRPEVSNLLRLLHLPPLAQESLRQGRISYGQARALLALEQEEKIVTALQRVEGEKLSVRETERMVKSLSRKREVTVTRHDLFVEEKERIAADLHSLLGTKVRVVSGAHAGKIEIEYYSLTDLRRIWEIITRQHDVSRET
jgi:ParB family chromosome partitioning protein